MRRKQYRSPSELESGLDEADFVAGCSVILLLGSIIGAVALLCFLHYYGVIG